MKYVAAVYVCMHAVALHTGPIGRYKDSNPYKMRPAMTGMQYLVSALTVYDVDSLNVSEGNHFETVTLSMSGKLLMVADTCLQDCQGLAHAVILPY